MNENKLDNHLLPKVVSYDDKNSGGVTRNINFRICIASDLMLNSERQIMFFFSLFATRLYDVSMIL